MADYNYAVLRVVPREDRGEAINVGVAVHSEDHDYVGLRVRLDEGRLLALDPGCDAGEIRAKLAALSVIGCGDGGVLAGLPAGDRFDALIADSSNVIRPSDVETGVTDDPEATLEQLFEKYVA
jgi:Protein of unknown function (DUF3037)